MHAHLEQNSQVRIASQSALNPTKSSHMETACAPMTIIVLVLNVASAELAPNTTTPLKLACLFAPSTQCSMALAASALLVITCSTSSV